MAKGEKSATFEFVTPVTGDQEGVWTVGGVEYDFDTLSKLDKVLNAGTQVALYNALNDLGITNLNADNAAGYKKAVTDLGTTDASEVTVKQIQDLVNKVNAAAVEADKEADIVKAVTEAKNQVTLLNALQNDAFTKVNPKWITEYDEKIDGTEESIEDIQGKINEVNTEAVKTATAGLDESVDKAKLLEAQKIVKDYAPVDSNGTVIDSTIKTRTTEIERQLAVAAVNEASTPTRLKSALDALDKQLGDSSDLLTNYKADNLNAYFNGVNAVNGIKDRNIAKVSDITTAISEINAEVLTEQNQYNNRIALNAGQSHIKDVNGKKYTGYSVNLKPFQGSTDKKITGITVELYKGTGTAAEVTNDSKNLLATNTATNKNLNALNGVADKSNSTTVSSPFDVFNDFDYVNDGYWSNNGWAGNEFDVPTAVKVTVKYEDGTGQKSADFTVDEATAQNGVTLTLVNKATTATEVNAALLGKPEESFLNVPTADKLFVAGKVLEAKNAIEGKKFANYDNLTSALDNVVGEEGSYTTALTGVNTLTAESTISEVRTALTAASNKFKALSNAEQAQVADQFFNSLEFVTVGEGEDATTVLKTPFRSLAAVEKAAGL